MKKITVLLLAMTILMIGIYVCCEIGLFKTLAITFAVTFYHFAMRLLIGFIYEKRFNNNISWKSRWFRVREKEMHIYKAIGVKRWKKYVPTYDSSFFDIRIKSIEQVIMAMCQAELVHETIIVFSFLPIIAAVWFGSIGVFVITSIASACVDLIFVILQRYNRPRILRILQVRTNNQN